MYDTYRHIMEAVKLPPDARQRIEAAVRAKNRSLSRTGNRRRTGWRRAVMAFCICLVMTACLAAAYTPERIRFGDQSMGEDVSFYRILPQITPWSGENLGGELQEDLAAGTLRQVHEDKQALEEYLGFALLENTLLDSADIVRGTYVWGIRPELEIDPEARYIVTATDPEGQTADTDPTVLKVTWHRDLYGMDAYVNGVTDGMDVYVEARILLAEMPETGLVGEIYYPVSMIRWLEEPEETEEPLPLIREPQYESYRCAKYRFAVREEYRMENGCIAMIISACKVEADDSDGPVEYTAHFVRNNILYTVRCMGTLAGLQVILDSFA